MLHALYFGLRRHRRPPTDRRAGRERRRDHRLELGRLRSTIAAVATIDRERGTRLEERLDRIEERLDAIEGLYLLEAELETLDRRELVEA